MKLSAFVSLIVGFPLIAMQIWMFVAPGLYRQEKRAFLPFLIATPFMFYAGCAVMYYIVLPYVINFMLTQYAPPDIEKTCARPTTSSACCSSSSPSASPSRCRCC